MNEELKRLFDADQALQENLPPFGSPEMAAVVEENRRRRARVQEILAAGGAESAEDCYHTAMVLHHTYDVEQVRKAHELAVRSSELGCGEARGLAAMALDRWLMFQGRPQKYGTQSVTDGSRWRVWTIDPATTDAERAEWGVEPPAEITAWSDRLTEERAGLEWPPEKAPEWLRERLDGWYI